MRASLIIGFVVIALVGLSLRHRGDRSHRHGPRAISFRQQDDNKPPKHRGSKPAAPKAPKAPEQPAEPKPAAEAQPPQVEMGPIPRNSDSSKAIWSKQIRGEPRASSQAARQSALETAADALDDYLKEHYPVFEWTPTAKFIADQKMIVNEKQEEQKLIDKEAPIMYTQTLTIELRDSQLREAFEENHHERVQTRLWQAGRGLGGLLIILLAIVGYVRLDDWTKGYISLPLKLTAAAVAIAGPAALWYLI